MKNGTEKIIAIGLGVCCWALWFVFLFFVVTKPYTEKVVIWLPDNYEWENNMKNEVISIMPKPDAGHQSDKVFYSQIDMESFKGSFGKSQMVAVKIQDASYPGNDYYRIVYQREFDCADKSFIISATAYYKYCEKTLSEMRLRDGVLFLKNKRDTDLMYLFSVVAFIAIAMIVSLYWVGLDIRSKQHKVTN